MRIALVLGEFSLGPRPLDFNNIWGSSRGLTGSELGIIMQAKELVALGHQVSLFVVMTDNIQPNEWEGISLFRLDAIHSDFDVMVSWNEPDVFRGIEGPLRVCSQMLNDFPYCKPGFEKLVDLWTCPSLAHKDHLESQLDVNFKALPLGCDPSWYSGEKVAGRVIWASSADRGLHHLLSQWHLIKKAVPHASLRIFYNFAFQGIMHLESGADDSTLELAQRVRYMLAAIKKLAPLGVELVGSVSRSRINQEMSAAECLAFPCDTRSFTEGFSIATLEACAAGACPVISDVDALGGIYAGVVPMVQSPVSQHLEQVSALVIQALTDSLYRDRINAQCAEFAGRHTWTQVTKQLIKLIEEHQ